ncbi:hypothetical protein [Trueperella sp. LYQ143]
MALPRVFVVVLLKKLDFLGTGGCDGDLPCHPPVMLQETAYDLR